MKKVIISDGHSDGWGSGGWSISELKEGDVPGKYVRLVEVTEEEWAEWQKFPKEDFKWDRFWDKKYGL